MADPERGGGHQTERDQPAGPAEPGADQQAEPDGGQRGGEVRRRRRSAKTSSRSSMATTPSTRKISEKVTAPSGERSLGRFGGFGGSDGGGTAAGVRRSVRAVRRERRPVTAGAAVGDRSVRRSPGPTASRRSTCRCRRPGWARPAVLGQVGAVTAPVGAGADGRRLGPPVGRRPARCPAPAARSPVARTPAARSVARYARLLVRRLLGRRWPVGAARSRIVGSRVAPRRRAGSGRCRHGGVRRAAPATVPRGGPAGGAAPWPGPARQPAGPARAGRTVRRHRPECRAVASGRPG